MTLEQLESLVRKEMGRQDMLVQPENILSLIHIARAAQNLEQNWKNGGVLVGYDELQDALAAFPEPTR